VTVHAARAAQRVAAAQARGDAAGAVSAVRGHRGPGSALPSPVAAWAQRHFGTSFGDVRVHTDDFAASAARALDANAFTVGRHVFFAPAMFETSSHAGRFRVAHELVHTLQQRGAGPVGDPGALEHDADVAVLAGAPAVRRLRTTGPVILREPTYPRRATADQMVVEAERILALSPHPLSSDPTRRRWSLIRTNFPATVTTGVLARRVWTHLFIRHFTEPDHRPGIESVHPRYVFSTTYGWIDCQHFFGFIDYAEQDAAVAGRTRQQAFDAATSRGIGIEADQQRIRDYVILGAPPTQHPTLRLLQVRPPNTPMFRAPQQVAGGAARLAALAFAERTLRGTQRELFDQLDEDQRTKFLQDSAKSAFSYEDIVSNQLGIRFYHQHARTIDGAPTDAERVVRFRTALASFFSSIGVVNDQARVDELARPLPMREDYLARKTTEADERRRHSDLFRLP
jgi:hypothetical protein